MAYIMQPPLEVIKESIKLLEDQLEDINADLAIIQAVVNNFVWHGQMKPGEECTDPVIKEMLGPLKIRWKKLKKRKAEYEEMLDKKRKTLEVMKTVKSKGEKDNDNP